LKFHNYDRTLTKEEAPRIAIDEPDESPFILDWTEKYGLFRSAGDSVEVVAHRSVLALPVPLDRSAAGRPRHDQDRHGSRYKEPHQTIL
jgi:hypothetical protein